MSIGAGHDGVGKVIAAFDDFADSNGLPAAARRSMDVVLDELLANITSHGLAARGDGQVAVDVGLTGTRLTVILSDDGPPFDPFGRAEPDTTLSVEDRPIGGLGIHLVRKLLDEVSYRREGDRNVVTLVKLLAGERAHGNRGGRSMQITTRTTGDVTIVAIAGNLDSMTSPEAQQALDGVVAGGGRKLVVDFSALDYISSAGLRVMLGTAKQLKAKGGALRTFGLNQTVREVFDISGFSTILAVFPAEGDALSGL